MTTCTDHGGRHLAPVCLWTAGGPQAALQADRAEIEALALLDPGSGVVHLGAGLAMCAIPMPQAGASVVAIDPSPLLLRTLEELRGGSARPWGLR